MTQTAPTASAAPSSFQDLGLAPAALAAVAELGFEQPTPVQAKAIPAVLSGADVLAQAQTGTGKTCAFVLPLLSTIAAGSGKVPARILVVTPTRELAQQVGDVCRTVGATCGHETAVVVGGVSYEGQKEALADNPDVVVATPGRLFDLVEQGYDVVFSKFFYLAAPNATDDAIVTAMNEGLQKAIENATFKTYCENAYVNPSYMTPEDTEKYYSEQYDLYLSYLGDYAE